MNILDRYILKQFILNFVILFLVLFLFTCIIDLFANIDEFIQAGQAMSKDGRIESTGFMKLLEMSGLILNYYAPRLVQFYTFLTGLVTVGATGFTLVQLHRHRELTAVLAAGVSLHRVAMPIIVAAIVLNAIQFINRELVTPRLAPLLLRDHAMVGTTTLETFRVVMLPDSFGRLFYSRKYTPDEQRLDDLVVLTFDDRLHLQQQITASSAVWQPYPDPPAPDAAPAEVQPQGDWMLTDGRIVTINGEAASTRTVPAALNHLPTDLDPTKLLLYRYRQFGQMLSLRQIANLRRYSILDEKQANDLDRIRFGRFSQIVTNLLTLLIALPFFLLRSPANLLMMCVGGAGVSLFAQIGGAVGTVLGLPGIPQIAGVFLFPLLILLPLSVALMSRVET